MQIVIDFIPYDEKFPLEIDWGQLDLSVGGLFLETATNSLQHNAYEYSLTLQPPYPCGLDNH